MKIVHISTSATGGAGIAAYRLHLGLLNTDCESFFLQAGSIDEYLFNNNVRQLLPNTSLINRIKKKLRLSAEQINKRKVPTYSSTYEITSLPTTSYKVEDFPLLQDADLIHLHWVAGFINYPTFFKNIKQPIIWTLHDKNPFHGIFHTETDENFNKEKYGSIDKKILADKYKFIHQCSNLHIVTPSKWLKEKSENSWIFKGYPHDVIPNGINIENCNINKQQAKVDLNVNNGLKTLMFIAHSIDIPRRGFHLLSKAIESLSNQRFNLISVGGGKIEINSSTVNHIHYNSTNNETLLNTIYAASDLMVLPTREDNLPNVMLESFANGTPVLSFSNGGMAEHIETGVNGILLNDINVNSLKTALEDFLQNKYIFDDTIIKDYAINHFSTKIQTDQYIKLYQDILNKKI